jgi:hypothetical protein
MGRQGIPHLPAQSSQLWLRLLRDPHSYLKGVTMTDVQGPFTKLRQRIKVLAVAASLVKSGDLVKGMTHEEMAQAIAAGMLESDPSVYGDPSFDWNSLIALIIQLLPIIMALFGL